MQILFFKNFNYYSFSKKHVSLITPIGIYKSAYFPNIALLLLQKCKSNWITVFHCYKSANHFVLRRLTATKAQINLNNGFLLLQKCKPTWKTVSWCYKTINQLEYRFCITKRALFFLNRSCGAWRKHYFFLTEVL